MVVRGAGVSRGGFYAWLTRPRSQRSRSDEELGAKVRASFIGSDRTYGAGRVWHDLLAEGVSCGLHRIERLMRLQALKARPRRRRLPPDLGERQASAVAPNVLDRSFQAPAANRKWIADFTYVWTAEGWLYVAEPYGVREAGGISLGGCQPNRVQARSLSLC
jgi:putative transposase